MSPRGAVFDSHLPQYRESDKTWTSGAKVGVATDGSLNEESDIDKAWSAELAIPFSAFKKTGSAPPKAGDEWAFNFFRTDALKDKTEYSAWSAPMRVDFHNLGRFKTLTFQGVMPPDEREAVGSDPPPKNEI